MGDLVAAGQPWGIVIASDGDKYILIDDTGYMEMWKDSGSGWTSVGTDQSYTDVHGKNATDFRYMHMVIDSSDVIHVVSQPNVDNAGVEIAYRQFSTSTDEWTGSWTEIADIDTYYTIGYHTMVVDPSDNIWVAWSDLDSKGGNANVTTDQSGSWATTNIGSGDVTEMMVSIGCDSSGNIHAFWRNSTDGGDWMYRQWTSGGGWGTVYQEDIVNLPYRHNVIQAGSSIYDAGLISNSIYLKDQSNTSFDTYLDTTATYDYVLQTYYDSKHYLVFIVYDGAYYLKIYEGSGTSWTLKATSAESGVSFYTIAAPYGGGDFVGVEAAYYAGGNTYYMQEFGTAVSSSQAAWAAWGGTPSDNQSAYTRGHDPHLNAHAFLDSIRDGGAGIHAHTEGMWPKGSQSAWMRGGSSILIDVVNFTTRTSTGNQDITGSLGGNTPIGVIFLGGDGISSDTEIDDSYSICFGAADGTNQFVHLASYYNTTGWWGYSERFDTQCFHVTANASGTIYEITASFNSFITNGVRINYSAVHSTGRQACAILFYGDPDDIDFEVQHSLFSSSWSDTETHDIEDFSFEPDMVMLNFMSANNNTHMWAQGVAFKKDGGILQRSAAVNIEDYNNFDKNSSNVLTLTQAYDYGLGWKLDVTDFLPNGYRVYIESDGNGVYMDTIGLRLSNYVAEAHWYDLSGGTGTKNFGGIAMTPEAVFAIMNPNTTHSFQANTQDPQFGWSAWDDTDEYSCSVSQGLPNGAEDVATVTSQANVLLIYDAAGKATDANHSSFQAGSFTLTINNSDSKGVLAFVFGEQLDDFTTSTRAYMYGAAHTQPAWLKGALYPDTSQKAFFHVVDGQTDIHCWLNGLNPARTDQSAMTRGTGDPLIIAVPFDATASGSQDITDYRFNGVTPKAALFILMGGENTSDALLSIGITDGTNSYCWGTKSSNDNYSFYANGYARWVDGSVMGIPNDPGDTTDPGSYAKAAFTSFITNGVRVNWDVDPGTRKGVVYLFAGDNISADCDMISCTGSVGTINVTAPGFEPDTIFTLEYGNWSAFYDYDESWGKFGWVINDNHSPRPTQMQVGYTTAPDDGWGIVGCYYAIPWYNSGDDAAYEGIMYGNTLAVTQFTANGFDVYDDSGLTAGTGIPYLAIKHTGKKSHIAFDSIGALNPKTVDVVTQPSGDWNVYPEVMLLHSTQLRLYERDYPYEDTIAGQGVTFGFNFQGAGTNTTLTGSCDGDEWDCISQYWDRRCKSTVDTTYQFHTWNRFDDYTWQDHIRAYVSMIRNGIRFELDYVHPETYHSQLWPLALLIGDFDIFTSQSAFTHGERANWPTRTPRGCYLSGTTPTASSSQKAFLNVATVSSQHVYIEGFTGFSDSTAVHLRGSLDASDSQSAFIDVDAISNDNQTAYLSGTGDYTTFKHVYLRASEYGTSSVSAYSNAGLGGSSSQAAWLRNGWVTSDQQSAYMTGAESTTSQHAYAEAAFDGEAWWAIPAFLDGGGLWPFSDDFSFSDGDSWDETKWVTEV